MSPSIAVVLVTVLVAFAALHLFALWGLHMLARELYDHISGHIKDLERQMGAGDGR